MMYHLRNFNVKPSPADHRDKRYAIKSIPLQQEIDLREWDSPVEDQGTLGSCVSHAMTSCYELMIKHNSPADFVELSRLYAYYHTRVLEESVNNDAGVVYLRNALKAAEKYGICREELWPYSIDKFKDQPTPNCYLDGLKHKVTLYQSVDSELEVFEAISDFKPILVGMTVYDSFITINNKNPVMPMPGEYDFVVGGHAVAVVGYSLPNKQFLIKNSFGTDWGDNGYCWMPFDYFKNHVFEKWVFDPVLNEQCVLTES